MGNFGSLGLLSASCLGLLGSGIAQEPGRAVPQSGPTVRVQVVDSAGKPVAGVILGIGDERRDDPRPLGTTDRTGEAVVTVPRHMLGTPRKLHVSARIGAAEDPAAEFASDSPPAERIVLRVPDTGQVRVVVYGDDEKPRTDVARVWLERAKENLGRRFEGAAEPSGAMLRVALGQSFTVRVALRGVVGELSATCVGPTRPNELVVCDVRGTQGAPVLSVLVRGIDGERVRDEKLGCVTVCDAWWNGTDLQTDAEGRVRIVLPEPRPEGFQVLLLRRGAASGPQPFTAYAGAALVPLPPDLHAGENRLPDARCAEEPTWVAGQVVDEAGKPVAGATVTCAPGWQRPSGGFGSGGRQVFFEHRLLTDEEGRFVVRDPMQQAEAKVNASAAAPGLAPAAATFAAGTTNARIVLRRTGQLVLELADVPSTPNALLECAVTAIGGGAEIQRFDVRGARTQLQLPAGRYDVVLRVDDKGPEVLRIAGIEVQPGGTCDDPRLRAAWREHLTLITLTVTDAQQRPVRGHMIWQWVAKSDGGFGGGGGQTDRDGRFVALVPKTGGHFRVEGGGGLRGAGLEAVTGDRTVVLSPTIPVRIEFEAAAVLPEGIQTQLQLKRVTPAAAGAAVGQEQHLRSLLESDRRGAVVLKPGADGKSAAALGGDGTYEVVMSVTEPISEKSMRFHSFSWGTFEVKDAAEPQEFRLTMPAAQREKLDALIERLKQ